MRAFRCLGAGGPTGLEEISTPKAGPGEVLIRNSACALNFADLLMIKGTYQDTPPIPFTIGMEVAGTIESVGPSAAPGTDSDIRLNPGMRVAAFPGSRGLAEYCVVPADRCTPLPDGVDFDEAAAMLVAYGTSHVALAHRARLQPGETLVVLGAAGGVGMTAVELGKLMGARVISVALGTSKREAVMAAGADIYLDGTTQDIREEIKALGGADVVYDPVGGASFTAAFRACRPEARIVIIGFASGDLPELKPNHMLVKNIDVMGFYWGSYFKFRPQVVTDSIRQLMAWRAEGRIHPYISHRFPLEEAAEALDVLRRREATGKVVVTI